MELLILGASGKTGRELITQGLQGGHRITAFVRDPARLEQRAGLRIMKGDVTDMPSVHKAMTGQDAVLCVLGQRSPFKRDPRLTQGMKNVLERMRTAGVHRLIHLSFAGVRDGREQGGWLLNLVMVPLLHAVVADHEDRERLIKNSHVAWTLVRAIRLTDGPYTGRFRYGEAIQPRSWMPRISRADVAGLMLRLLDEPASIHKAYLATH